MDEKMNQRKKCPNLNLQRKHYRTSEEKDLNDKPAEDHEATESKKMNFIMEKHKTSIADLPMDL